MQAVAHFAELREHARRERVLPASLLEFLRGLLGDRLARELVLLGKLRQAQPESVPLAA